MSRLAMGVERWDRRRFAFLHELQEAPRNNGRVDAMRDLRTGRLVAVKRMPNWWIRSGPEGFSKRRPEEMERPWADLGLLKELNKREFPYSCDLIGLFSDGRDTCAVTSLAQGGDLFSWVQGLPASPSALEEATAPVAAQLCEAVGMLHQFGIAHLDLSLENALLAPAFCPWGGRWRVKLIDFGMCMAGRMRGSEARPTAAGKQSYRAPELHAPGIFDTFAADAFSVGVMLYCMTFRDYPWSTTKPGASASLERARRAGMWAHVSTRLVNGEAADSVLSEELLELTAGLMEIDPSQRLCLGESCMLEEGHECALDSAWLQAFHGCAKISDPDDCEQSTAASTSESVAEEQKDHGPASN